MIRTGTLQITPEILNLIAGLDEFKGAWKALGALAPERHSALRRVAAIESIGSSTRIEGSKLSDRQVGRLLSNLEIKTFATRDEQEVAGYAKTMELLFQSWEEITLTENHVKQLHRDLLQYSEKARIIEAVTRPNRTTLPRSTRPEQVGIVFETASPFDAPRRISELIAWTSGAYSARQLHPLLVTAIFTVVLLEIHPFQDGNGR
jgi:Fic family protein